MLKAVRETFQRRKTHDIPSTLIPLLASRPTPFAEMVVERGLEPDMEKLFGVVEQFFSRLNP